MQKLLFSTSLIGLSLTANSQLIEQLPQINQMVTSKSNKVDSLTPERIQMLRASILIEKGDSAFSAEDAFFEQLKKLPEFQAEQKRIKALRLENCEPVKLNVDYNEKPELDINGSAELSMILLYEEHQFLSSKKLYTILFDKRSFQIISVENNRSKTTRKIDHVKS